MSLPTVTIIIPMWNEQDYIEACLASLCAQDYPAELLEILVLDGDSSDRSPEMVANIGRADRRVRLLPNPRRTQAAGLNEGIPQARGEIVVRADAHAVYGPSYVATCVKHLTAGRAECVGGLQRGVGTTPFGKAVAAALNTPLGAGNAPYRLAKEVRYADTVWLGSWRRQTLLELGGFDEEMVPNEDYELNCRLRERGGRILLDPSLPSTYYPRTSPARLWRQYFRYGRAKIRTLRRHPQTLVLRQLVVPAFLLALLLTAACLPWSAWPLCAVGGIYLLAVLLGVLYAAPRAGGVNGIFLPLIFPIIHLAWSLGFYWEMIRLRTFPLRLRGLAESERLVQTGDPRP